MDAGIYWKYGNIENKLLVSLYQTKLWGGKKKKNLMQRMELHTGSGVLPLFIALLKQMREKRICLHSQAWVVWQKSL